MKKSVWIHYTLDPTSKQCMRVQLGCSHTNKRQSPNEGHRASQKNAQNQQFLNPGFESTKPSSSTFPLAPLTPLDTLDFRPRFLQLRLGEEALT